MKKKCIKIELIISNIRIDSMKINCLSYIINCILIFLLINNFTTYAQVDNAWQKLFNGKNLEGWTTFLASKQKQKPYLIDKDPNKIFQVVEGNLHFYKDQVQDSIVQEGYICTTNEYSNYRLKFEFKWGDKKFAQRKSKNKNSGLFFHVQEPTGFWPTCIECQIMEGSVGEIYAQNFAWFTTTIDSLIIDPVSNKIFPRYSENGKLYDYGGKQTSMRMLIPKRLDQSDGWNKIEIEVHGNTATFYVNDKLAAKLWNIRYIPPENLNEEMPLIKGRICLQAEATEIIFRNIEIQFEDY